MAGTRVRWVVAAVFAVVATAVPVGAPRAARASALVVPGVETAPTAPTAPTVPCVDPRGCPDLQVDATVMAPRFSAETFDAHHCDVQEGSTQPGDRTLLRFVFASPNVGAGDLVIGKPELHPEWFEFHPCHNHYHFREYADYRLWTPAAYERWDALRRADPAALPADVLAANPDLAAGLITGEKKGFCVIDFWQYDPNAGPAKYNDCGNLQGISAGWADVYSDVLSGQYVDVTGAAPGDYVLEGEVNPERLFDEADYSDNRSATTVRVPGADLAVAASDVVVSPGTDRVRTVNITVHNAGDVGARDVTVTIADGGTEFGRAVVADLPAGGATTVAFRWDTRGPRDRVLAVAVDPADAIAELDETNNAVTVNVSLRS